MNRKLHNTLTAGLVCSLVLLAALIAATPTPPPDQRQSASAHASLTARASQQSLQSVRMPFFSFFLPRS